MISENSTLEEFQESNRSLYLVVNDQNYSNTEIFSCLHRHTTQVLKAVRKEKYDDIRYHLCMSLSWSLALANRFHVNLTDETWKRFPGFCPYCLAVPCACKERPKEREKISGEPTRKQPASLREWQQMFAEIYPNIVINSAIHLAEEAGEVDEAIRNYLATHSKDWFNKFVEELVDVITNIFGVANCLKLDVATGMASYFANGCPGCGKTPCSCGYVTVDQTRHH
jgi:NTP pyrophosphatase (non-canonical NTP hydrolase)